MEILGIYLEGYSLGNFMDIRRDKVMVILMILGGIKLW